MKLVRESLFEKFSEDGDPIADMGIGSKYLIKQWFESMNVKPNEYIIDDNLNIIVNWLDLRGTNVTKLPNNLSVKGFLYLTGSQITELPDNLSVGGSLWLKDTSITELPYNLSVGRDLDIRGTKITKLPKTLKVKGTIFKDL